MLHKNFNIVLCALNAWLINDWFNVLNKEPIYLSDHLYLNELF